MVTLDNLRNQKYLFLILNRLILKVTKFQLPPLKRLGTVVKNILGGHAPCQIGLKYYGGHQSEKHWQNHSTKAVFKVKNKEIVYISQSDLGVFQLIFKEQLNKQCLKPCF